MDPTILIICVGGACLLSSIFFYCTYRHTESYNDSEVGDINRTRIISNT